MESGIEPSVDLDTLDERIKIREMILKGQIQEAIALINSLHPELLDTNRYLYFHLQVSGGARGQVSLKWKCSNSAARKASWRVSFKAKGCAVLPGLWAPCGYLSLCPSPQPATAPDRADPPAGDGGGTGVRADSAGGARGGEQGVPDGDGAHAGPAGLRQPRGLTLRGPSEHDAAAEGEGVTRCPCGWWAGCSWAWGSSGTAPGPSQVSCPSSPGTGAETAPFPTSLLHLPCLVFLFTGRLGNRGPKCVLLTLPEPLPKLPALAGGPVFQLAGWRPRPLAQLPVPPPPPPPPLSFQSWQVALRLGDGACHPALLSSPAGLMARHCHLGQV